MDNIKIRKNWYYICPEFTLTESRFLTFPNTVISVWLFFEPLLTLFFLDQLTIRSAFTWQGRSTGSGLIGILIKGLKDDDFR